MHAEVDVAVEMVGEEAHGVLQGQQRACERQAFAFGVDQERTGAAKIALSQGAEPVEVDRDPARVGFVFRRRRCRGARQLTEIAQRGAGHHRVQVDDAGDGAGVRIDEHVVELGVVVHDPARELLRVVRGELALEPVAEPGRGVDQIGCGARAFAAIGGDRRFELLASARKVVEVRNRLDERRIRKVVELAREPGEPLRGGAHVGAGRLVREYSRVLDEHGRPPLRSRLVGVHRGARASRNRLGDDRRHAVGRRAGSKMGRDALTIGRERDEIAKDGLVQALQNNAFRRVRLHSRRRPGSSRCRCRGCGPDRRASRRRAARIVAN